MNPIYTTDLQAGLGMLPETHTLLDIWQPGMTAAELFQTALHSGAFPNISASRLQSVIGKCFAPRYLGRQDYPAWVLKQSRLTLPTPAWQQLLFLFTARANTILADFVTQVYWPRYASGQTIITNPEARAFVIQAIQAGKTTVPWSAQTIRRMAGYLTGCCADFGLLESGRRTVRKIQPYRMETPVMAFLAYDRHFAGLSDQAVLADGDWAVFGLTPDDVRAEFKRLALRGFWIIQTAGDLTRISWTFSTWEEALHGITES